MRKFIGKKSATLLLVSVCIALMGGESVFAKSKAKSELVKEEDGFYYGYGEASTKEDAEFMAKKDLIETALTTIVRTSNPKASRVNVSDDCVNARLTNIKPFSSNKPGTNVTYRIKLEAWDKDEKAFSEKLRESLTPRYTSLTSSEPVSDKIDDAIFILNELTTNGETDLLTLQEDGTEMFAKKVEAICTSIVNDLNFELSTADGFIGPDSTFGVSVKDGKGRAVANLTLKAEWAVADLPITTGYGEVAEVVSILKTDNSGNAVIDYPISEEYKNKAVTLTVSTAFSTSELASKAMKKLDASSSVDGCYVYYDDFAAAYAGVSVEAGDFNAGAVEADTRAGKKEAAHTVTLDAYQIDVTPVTNAKYADYLFITRSSDYPDYFDNEDYNNSEQPVTGVSLEKVQAYAEWLSEVTGETYRLPTEEEWEKAARAGEENIYPWGNDDPSKGKKANYKGNGKYKVPSPVGAFPESTNAWGLVDMSGNVWEWTTSQHNIPEDSTTEYTVKGGSWMDGPTELRISNYKNVDAASGYPDVGFRLVKEVKESEGEKEELINEEN